MTTVYQAIRNVMADIDVVKKAERNTQQGYNFRGIDAVVNAVGPAFRKHGVFVAPSTESYEYQQIEVGTKGSRVGHAIVTVLFTWFGPEGDSLTTIAVAEAMDSGDKAIAKAHSVAYRTTLLQTLSLPTDEADPDSSSYERPPQSAPAEPSEEPAGRRMSRTRRPKLSEADEAREYLLGACEQQNVPPPEATARFAALGHGDLRTSTNADAIRSLADSLGGADWVVAR